MKTAGLRSHSGPYDAKLAAQADNKKREEVNAVSKTKFLFLYVGELSIFGNSTKYIGLLKADLVFHMPH